LRQYFICTKLKLKILLLHLLCQRLCLIPLNRSLNNLDLVGKFNVYTRFRPQRIHVAGCEYGYGLFKPYMIQSQIRRNHLLVLRFYNFCFEILVLATSRFLFDISSFVLTVFRRLTVLVLCDNRNLVIVTEPWKVRVGRNWRNLGNG
jgi:hypothetical protein